MRSWITTVGLVALSLLFLREVSLLPDGKLHLHVLDVGQGDAILLITPSGKQILVDGGPDLSTLEHLGRLLPFFDRTIELMILTHPDADHIAALPDVIDRYRVERILMGGVAHTSGKYDRLLAGLKGGSTTVLIAEPRTDIDLGDGVLIDVIWPSHSARDDVRASNDLSVVTRVLYGDRAILLTGDIEERAERAILVSGADIRADILKAPHHGSKTSSSTGFLLAVRPDVALISAGKGNRFGHPHAIVLDRYQALGIRAETTARGGTISVQFRGD